MMLLKFTLIPLLFCKFAELSLLKEARRARWPRQAFGFGNSPFREIPLHGFGILTSSNLSTSERDSKGTSSSSNSNSNKNFNFNFGLREGTYFSSSGSATSSKPGSQENQQNAAGGASLAGGVAADAGSQGSVQSNADDSGGIFNKSLPVAFVNVGFGKGQAGSNDYSQNESSNKSVENILNFRQNSGIHDKVNKSRNNSESLLPNADNLRNDFHTSSNKNGERIEANINYRQSQMNREASNGSPTNYGEPTDAALNRNDSIKSKEKSGNNSEGSDFNLPLNKFNFSGKIDSNSSNFGVIFREKELFNVSDSIELDRSGPNKETVEKPSDLVNSKINSPNASLNIPDRIFESQKNTDTIGPVEMKGKGNITTKNSMQKEPSGLHIPDNESNIQLENKDGSHRDGILLNIPNQQNTANNTDQNTMNSGVKPELKAQSNETNVPETQLINTQHLNKNNLSKVEEVPIRTHETKSSENASLIADQAATRHKTLKDDNEKASVLEYKSNKEFQAALKSEKTAKHLSAGMGFNFNYPLGISSSHNSPIGAAFSNNSPVGLSSSHNSTSGIDVKSISTAEEYKNNRTGGAPNDQIDANKASNSRDEHSVVHGEMLVNTPNAETGAEVVKNAKSKFSSHLNKYGSFGGGIKTGGLPDSLRIAFGTNTNGSKNVSLGKHEDNISSSAIKIDGSNLDNTASKGQLDYKAHTSLNTKGQSGQSGARASQNGFIEAAVNGFGKLNSTAEFSASKSSGLSIPIFKLKK